MKALAERSWILREGEPGADGLLLLSGQTR